MGKAVLSVLVHSQGNNGSNTGGRGEHSLRRPNVSTCSCSSWFKPNVEKCWIFRCVSISISSKFTDRHTNLFTYRHLAICTLSTFWTVQYDQDSIQDSHQDIQNNHHDSHQVSQEMELSKQEMELFL